LASRPEGLLRDDLLAALSGLAVDLTAVAALSSLEVDALTGQLAPVLVLTTLGGLATLLAVLWLARRAFPDAPFEHAVLMFGTATGTLPTGLALLRVVDPHLRSPAPSSAVIGSALAIPSVAPMLLGLHPLAVEGWRSGRPGWIWASLALLLAFGGLTLLAWARWGGLRAAWRPLSLWPTEDPRTDA
jgi:ESS family glutamate:Na+ symporter